MRKFLRDISLLTLQNELFCDSSNAPSGFFREMPVLAYKETFDNEAIVKMLLNPNINPEIICPRVPNRCQTTMAFIVNLDPLSDQSDIIADDNGVYFNSFGRVMHVYWNVDEKYVYVKSISGSEDPLDDGKSDYFILTKYNGTAKSCKDFHLKIIRLKLSGSPPYFQYCYNIVLKGKIVILM